MSFVPSVVLPSIAQPNNTIKKKRESYIPSTTHPPKPTLPSSSAFSGGLFRGIDTNDNPDPDPATAAFPEIQIVRLPNFIRLDSGRVGEEAPEGVGSRLG